MKSSSQSKDFLVRPVLFLIVALLLSMILWKQPFWGLMDDHYNVITMLPEISKQGLFPYALGYGMHDLEWGMFRPTYPIMVYLLYLPAWHSAPWVLYFWNTVLCVGLLLLCAKVYARITSVSVHAILIFYASFFYLYDLFQHPSLQEKFIHLFGILLLYCCSRPKLTVGTWFWAFVFLLLGVMTKASFVLYLSMAVWVVFWRDGNWKKRFFVTLPIFLSLIASVLFFAYVSKHGEYTAKLFSISNVIPNILSIDGVMFIFPLMLVFGYALYTRKIFSEPLRYTPLIGTAAFLAVFLPWGIKGYLHTLAGPFFCVLLAFCAEEFVPARFRAFWIFPLAIFALAIGSYRSVTIFGRLGDVREIVARTADWEKSGLKELEMPCSEGSRAMTNFLKMAQVPIKVNEIRDFSQPAQFNGKYFLFDSAVCPMPGRVLMVPGCEMDQTLYRGSFAKSFQVVKVRCPVN